ncbi:GDSL-type esterase/lipase family protein [Acinetobacter baumannii]|uniref:GDSL-type esterase/lipase family protein n=1 Tax=Acinetobacter baumannii TaxID=470 RepID=UPI00244C8D1F|nr:GDSL-type esterase/lipase family protein [Acinetobacter baumannii]MDH2567120.1 GDSL-type esterase/lipase family protein [Acinetobacter baumannii]
MALPNIDDLIGAGVTEAGFKTALQQFLENVVGLEAFNGNKLANPSVVSAAINFDDYKSRGYYYFASGTVWDASTNKPTGISNQWAYLFVMPISANVVGQFVWCFNSQKMALRFCNASNVWSSWAIFSDDTALTTIVKASVNKDRDDTFESRSVNSTSPVFETLSKNLFDKSVQLLSNYRLNASGVIEANTNSVLSQLINVKGLTSIAVSGLQASTAAYRAYRFLDINKAKISNSSIAPNLTEKVIAVPAGAVWFQLTLKDSSDSWVLDTSTIQIESGTASTAFTAYIKGKLKELFGASVLVDSAQVKDILNPVFSSKSKNIFDKDALVKDYRIDQTGALEYKLNSVMTRLISVKELTSIAVSGLQASTAAYRAYRFLDINKAKISNSSIAPNLTEKVIAVPAGAVWFQLTLKDSSDSWALDTSTIQIEAGNAVTAYTPYVRGNLLSLYDADVGSSGSTGSSSKAFGARYLIFGDSITQTSDVDNNIFDQVSHFTQWPTYAYEKLKMSQFRNYAKSGASFRNRNLSNLYQYLGYQVETAIANNEVTDVVIVSCGTNDGITNLGSYETAMSKATKADLDKTLLFEASRYAFWSIREKWPDAICFYCVPLQRASADTAELSPMLDGLTKMAKRYGFTIIDQHSESGIIRDFEILGAEGKFLADGLHPNTAGKILQAIYICAKIIARMMA